MKLTPAEREPLPVLVRETATIVAASGETAEWRTGLVTIAENSYDFQKSHLDIGSRVEGQGGMLGVLLQLLGGICTLGPLLFEIAYSQG